MASAVAESSILLRLAASIAALVRILPTYKAKTSFASLAVYPMLRNSSPSPVSCSSLVRRTNASAPLVMLPPNAAKLLPLTSMLLVRSARDTLLFAAAVAILTKSLLKFAPTFDSWFQLRNKSLVAEIIVEVKVAILSLPFPTVVASDENALFRPFTSTSPCGLELGV